MSLPKTRKMVEQVLIDHPITRDSDQILMEKVREVYYGIIPRVQSLKVEKVFIIPVNLFRSLPNKDDIKRIRARFNQLGLYISDKEEVRRHRKMSEEKYLQFLQYR